MGYLLLILGISIPWLGGYYWLRALEKRFAPERIAHPARQIGYGFFLGYAGLQGLLLLNSALLDTVTFAPVFALASVVTVAGYLLVRRFSATGRETAAACADRTPGWQRALFWVLLLWSLLHLSLAALEVFARPTYPWDAWLAWTYRAKAWFFSEAVYPLASPAEWLGTASSAPYTIAAHDYPVFASLMPFWAATSLGQWSETLVNIPALLCGAAIAAGLYGQCREAGLAPSRSIIAPYAFLSLPLAGTHLALAGYADIWMTGFSGLGFVALIRGLLQRNMVQGCLGLLLLFLATMVKNEAVVWLYVAAGTCLLSYLRVRTSLLLMGLAVGLLALAWITGYTYIELPLLGGLGLSDGQFHIPFTGSHRVQLHDVTTAYLDAMFVQGSWNLLWGGLVLVMVTAPWLGDRRLGKVAAAFLLAFGASQLFIFALTEQGVWASTFTAINRLPLHFTPALIFLLLLSAVCATAGQHGGRGNDRGPAASMRLPLVAALSLILTLLTAGLYMQASYPASGEPGSGEISDLRLRAVIGRGETTAGGLQVSGAKDGVAIVSSGSISLDADSRQLLRYDTQNSSTRHPAFFWRRAASPDDIHMVELPRSGRGALQLANQEDWSGTISELGIAFYGESWDRAQIGEFRITPSTVGANLDALWRNWTIFQPWSQSSINSLEGGQLETRLSLPVALLIWSALAVLLLCIPGLRYPGQGFKPVSTAFTACMLGWLLFDLNWTRNQMTQALNTVEYARERGEHNYLDVGNDKYVEELAASTRRQASGEVPGRTLVLAIDRSQEFAALRAKYHLLPLAATVSYGNSLAALDDSFSGLLIIAPGKQDTSSLMNSLRQRDKMDDLESERIAANRVGTSYQRQANTDQNQHWEQERQFK
jgi:hypothetical protein